MAISQYLRHDVGTEQNLYVDLIVESIQHYGINTYYLPRTIVSRDIVLNSDTESQFNDAFVVEMYPENIDGYGGTGDLMQKFGFEIKDEVTLVVAKRSWEKWVGMKTAREQQRPLEGDIVYIPYSKSYFEVTHVEHEQPFYQLANLPTYKLKCSLFEYNEEVFRTGLKEIDEIKYKFAKRTVIHVTNIVGQFKIGDRLNQVIQLDPEQIISGEIVSINESTGMIELIDLAASNGQFGRYDEQFGMFLAGETAYGQSSLTTQLTGATCIVDHVFTLDSPVDQDDTNDGNSQSYEFENLGDDIIDFSETNVFGEP
jgi:hypothetical protein